jgi:nitrite reductase (NO-forming)
MYIYIILEILAIIGAAISLFMLARMLWLLIPMEKFSSGRKIIYSIAGFLLSFMVGLYAVKTVAPSVAMPPWMHTYAPGGHQPDLPLWSAGKFFARASKFERIPDIGANPNGVPAPIERTGTTTVKLLLTTKEVISEIAPGVYFNYWTYEGQVPGPMLRIKEGDDVELTLKNDLTSLHMHSIDLHAVSGPGGGAKVLEANPGESKTLKWRAENPGLYIYHCATMSASSHNAHGQYGLILVEPKEGLSKVDKEFYVVQGELFTQGDIGRKGLTAFDAERLVDENPTYITFNGRVEKETRMHVKVGEKVRIYVGNGGLTKVSSFHVIGAIFDKVYTEGSMGSSSVQGVNVQTTVVPAGGSAIVEFTPKAPGKYVIVDHALARLNKGAWMTLEVSGEEVKEVYQDLSTNISTPIVGDRVH